MMISALIFGLLGSFHCIGMCGPIAFMLPVSRDNKIKKVLQIFLYHGGRLFAYSTIGLAFGLIGRSLHLFGFQQQLSIFTGILMIIAILIPNKTFRRYNLSEPLMRFIGKIKSSLGTALKKRTPDTFLTIGFLNGLLPCGLVYMAVFGALATGSIYQGSLYMLLFGLGTIPLMTGAIYFSGMLSGLMRQRVQKLIPVMVITLGLLFIIRGLGLEIPYLSPAPITEMASSTTLCH